MSGGHQVESGEEGLNINALLKLESRFFHVNSWSSDNGEQLEQVIVCYSELGLPPFHPCMHLYLWLSPSSLALLVYLTSFP